MSKKRSRANLEVVNNSFYLEDLKPKNFAQKQYYNSIKVNTITFGIGPAGTGKTYIAAYSAAQALAEGRVNKIIVTRPIVGVDEDLGYLPGTLEAKFMPYFYPVKDVLDECFGKNIVKSYMECGKIEIAPLAYMRGRSFKDSFVLLDEAQNTTEKQMKLFLTRLGFNNTCVVDGDPNQKDVQRSGLDDAIRRLAGIKYLDIINFTNADIVRAKIVQDIVNRYEDTNITEIKQYA